MSQRPIDQARAAMAVYRAMPCHAIVHPWSASCSTAYFIVAKAIYTKSFKVRGFHPPLPVLHYVRADRLKPDSGLSFTSN